MIIKKKTCPNCRNTYPYTYKKHTETKIENKETSQSIPIIFLNTNYKQQRKIIESKDKKHYETIPKVTLD